MSTLVKAGEKSAAAKTTKTKREVTPKLVCILTGASRFTNKDYLASKAGTAGSIGRFIKHYVSSDAMKMLREMAGEKPYAGLTGTTVATIREKLKVKDEDVKDVGTPSIDVLKVALDINGKRAKKVSNKPAKVATTPKTPAKPRAPRAPKAKAATTDAPAAANANAGSTTEPTTPAGS